MYESFYLNHIKNPIIRNGRIHGLCPFHKDTKPSFNARIDNGIAKCFGCGWKGNAITFSKKLGIPLNEIPGCQKDYHKQRKIIAEYNYTDEKGNLLFQVVRFYPKYFRQRRPDGNGGWIWNLNGTRKVLYRLPLILNASMVINVEGEKDVDNLIDAGFVATTNPGGAGKWRAENNKFLKDKDVVLIPDNDEVGRKHMEQISESLKGITKSIKILELPGLKPKGDVSDYLKTHTPSDLQKLIDAATPIKSNIEINQNRKLNLVRLSDITSEQIEFLSEPYIPIGKLTSLEGDPGVGKSWICAAIATATSLGKGLPGMKETNPGNVLLLSTEDGLRDTIKPRLESLQADCSKIFIIPEPFEFTYASLLLIEEKIKQCTPKVIIIDPIQAYIGSKINMNLANETRPILANLAQISDKFSCAMIIIRHLTKGGRDKGLYRGMGSIDFAGACRSILLAGCDKDDPERRAIIHLKSNIAKKGKPLGFKLEDNKFYWCDTNMTEGDILGAKDYEATPIEEAEDFLLQILKDGPILAEEIEKQRKENGISKRTLHKAKENLKVKSIKDGYQGKWAWKLDNCKELQ